MGYFGKGKLILLLGNAFHKLFRYIICGCGESRSIKCTCLPTYFDRHRLEKCANGSSSLVLTNPLQVVKPFYEDTIESV